MANAFGRPPKPIRGVREDGVGVDLIDLTDRTYPAKNATYSSIKAGRVGAIHDSTLVRELPKATRQYLHEHGKAGICCESTQCEVIQPPGQKLSLKRCARVSVIFNEV